MNKTSERCPICHEHDKRINFKGGPAGFTLEIFPGHQPEEHALAAHTDAAPANAGPTLACIDAEAEPIGYEVPVPDQIDAEAEPNGYEVPVPDKEPERQFFRQVMPICNPADPLTTADQLAFYKHRRATKRPLTLSLTDQGAARF